MEIPDFAVIGEICLDIFAEESSSRPGGSFYSAYAARKLGVNTAIIGHIGVDDEETVLPFLHEMGISDINVKRVPGPITRYFLEQVDEILPLRATTFKNSCLIEIDKVKVNPNVLLCYPYPSLDYYLEQYPESLKGIDVQYDIDIILDLKLINDVDVIFISSSDVCKKTNNH